MRRASLSFFAALAGRLLSTAITLLSVPLTIGYLGAERYGLWITASSAVAMLSFADLGIGNGLLTSIAEADGRQDRQELRKLVSSSFTTLAVVAAVLACLLVVLVQSLDWGRLLNLSTPLARAEAPRTVMTLGLVTILSMPLNVVTQVQNGRQQSYAATLWSIGGTMLSLVSLLVATQLQVGLLGLVLAISASPVLSLIGNFLSFFCISEPDLRPRLSAASWRCAWSLLKVGVLFVVLQVAGSFLFLTDNLVVAKLHGASAVSNLAVPSRLFAVASLPVMLLTAPLWPAFGEAKARGDVAWIVRTLKRTTSACVAIAVVLAVFLLAIGRPIVQAWSHGVVSPGFAVMLPLAIWSVLLAWGTAIAAFLNGNGTVLPQALTAAATALVAFPLKWVLVVRLGPQGAVWATIAGYLPLTFLPLALLVRATVRSMLADAGNMRSQDTIPNSWL